MGNILRQAANLALACFALLCGVLLAETIVRLVRPQALLTIDHRLYVKAPPLRFALRPGYRGRLSNLVELDTAINVNMKGMRDDEIPDKAPGEQRLLILGDSFVFGWGVNVDETFARQLQRDLIASFPTLRVLNGGVPGYGLTDVADWLEYRGLQLEPDMVLVGIFLGNDLLDVTEKYRLVDLSTDPMANRSLVSRMRNALYRHSHLVRLIQKALPPALTMTLRGWLGLPEPSDTLFLRELLGTFADEPTALAREGYEASRLAMGRLSALAHQHGFRLLIALLPGPLEADEGMWQKTLNDLGALQAHYEHDRPAHFFHDLAVAADLPFCDLTPTFRKSVDERREALFFRFDPHWTVAGHRLAADTLRDFVVEQGLRNARPIQLDHKLNESTVEIALPAAPEDQLSRP